MKKKILLLIILVLSIFSFKGVNAKVSDVSIKSVEQIEKNGMTEEVSEAKFSGMNINFDLVFHGVNDSIKYKVTLQNKGEEEIYINNKGEMDGSKYITYDYVWDDNINVIKGNSTKTFDLIITYKNLVEDASFKNGNYEEVKNLVIKISDEEGNVLPATNPKTDSNLSIFIILLSIEILVFLGVITYLIKNKKLNLRSIKKLKKVNLVSMFIFVGLTLLTVIGYSYALEMAEIKVDSRIKISKARLARSCSSDSYTLEKTGFCLDWEGIFDSGPVCSPKMNAARRKAPRSTIIIQPDELTGNALITVDTKAMPETMNLKGYTFTLEDTMDVSNLQNGEVILGIYSGYGEDSYRDTNYATLLVLGQDGGVLAPVDSSWLFASARPSLPSEAVIDSDDETSIPSRDEIDEVRYLNENIMISMSYMDLSKLNVADTNNMSRMFATNGAYAYNWNLYGLDKWDTSNVSDMYEMFALTGIDARNYTISSLTNFNVLNVKDMSYMFFAAGVDATNVYIGDISKWNISEDVNTESMFEYAFNGKYE